MHYLITGATGFLGPYLIRRLTSLGHTCRCLIRAGSNTSQLKEFNVEFVTGDITDPKTLDGIAEGMEGLPARRQQKACPVKFPTGTSEAINKHAIRNY